LCPATTPIRKSHNDINMFNIATLVAFLGLVIAFWFWHSPIRRKLTPEEIDRYLAEAAKLTLPANEQQAVLARLRAWAKGDDGKPVYMLNLMRLCPELRSFPGIPDFQGTPEQANAYYESSVLMLLLKRAGYPMVGGKAQGENLLEAPPALDNWSRVVVVRYPSRRAFLRLLADPVYALYEPYKFMALETALVPVSKDLTVPDLRWIVGGVLVILYLALGWIRAVIG
jgi:hypothetical protein